MFLAPRRKSRCGLVLVLFTILNLVFFSISYDDKRQLIENFDILNAKKLFNEFMAKNSNLNNSKDSKFDNSVRSKIVDQKTKETPDETSEKFWYIDDNVLKNSDYDFAISNLVEKEAAEKLNFFDPRFTIAIYLRQINELLAQGDKEALQNHQFKFHWSDWNDLSILNNHIAAGDKNCKSLSVAAVNNPSKNKKDEVVLVESYCLNADSLSAEQKKIDGNGDLRPGFNVFKHSGRSTKEKKLLEAKSYLYSFAPAPLSIVFLVGNSSVSISTDHSKREKLINSKYLRDLLESSPSLNINALEEINNIKKNYVLDSSQFIADYEVDIPQESFMDNHEMILSDLEGKGLENLVIQEQNYLNSIKYSIDQIKKGAPKYFSEAKLLKRVVNYGLGAHYDWRFFNGVINFSEEQNIVLHRLLRVWLSFTRNHGIVTWIAHGSLLSWYWDGLAFPWDTDIDVQMPLHDLHELSRRFNQSLIVEDTEDGFGRYFLDCGSFITQRMKGNGNNNIDARFIDVDTGLYIDITCLALTETIVPQRYREIDTKVKRKEPPPVATVGDPILQNDLITKEVLKKNIQLQAYNCRNNHFALHSEISPLKLSLVEGVAAYIPNNFENILRAEYAKGLIAKKFKGYTYLPQLRIWVLTRYIQKYMRSGASQAKSIKDFDDNDLLKLMDEFSDILSEYYISKHLTSLHQQEMHNIMNDVSSEAIVRDVRFNPIRPDLFMFRLHSKSVASKGLLKDSHGVDLTGENEVNNDKDLNLTPAEATDKPITVFNRPPRSEDMPPIEEAKLN